MRVRAGGPMRDETESLLLCSLAEPCLFTDDDECILGICGRVKEVCECDEAYEDARRPCVLLPILARPVADELTRDDEDWRWLSGW